MGYASVFGSTAISPAQVQYLALALTANLELVWPLESIGGANYFAQQIDVTPNAAGRVITLPPANQGSSGNVSIMTNLGADTFTVKDNAGNTIASIATTQAWIITLTNNSTVAGVWRTTQLGATTSSATAAALAGAGLEASANKLRVLLTTVYLNTNTAINSTYRAKAVVWNGVSGTLQLDTIANLNVGWFMWVKNAGPGTLTISTTGVETINGDATLVLPPGSDDQDSFALIVCAVDGFNSFGTVPASINSGGLVEVLSGASYTVPESIRYVIVNKTVSSATTINLPLAPAEGYTVTIKDGKGDAGTYPIKVVPAGGVIDGATFYIIVSNYGSVTATWDGTDWFLS